MEISCGQKFIERQRVLTGKSFRSNQFLGSFKDKGYNLDSNVSVRFSGRNTGKLHSILDGNRVLQILPRTGRSFRDLRTYSRVQCDYCHFGQDTR
ncbi:hypothetical protein AB3S75_033428 [Citrus x aurantiifolia]